MARRKSLQPKKQKKKTNAKSGGRPIWQGSINFGLVSIPVALYSAEADGSIDFDLLDRRDFSRVRYRRVNEKTGREVPWNEIVKGYKYEKGEYVALTDDDFLKANVKATQSIDLLDFVDGADISPIYYDKPYYLVPLKNGRRAYALLREVMQRTGRVGIARVVIRSRQHLAALLVEGSVSVLNLLRFSHELRDPAALDVPKADSARGSNQELKMAEQLVETMAGKWNPKKYRDDYRQDLLQMIDAKIKSGQTKVAAPAEPARPPKQGQVVDIMHLLRRSMEHARKRNEPPRRRKAS
jgi:DNA end-binding protein Ku